MRKKNTKKHGLKKRKGEERKCTEIKYCFKDHISSSGNGIN